MRRSRLEIQAQISWPASCQGLILLFCELHIFRKLGGGFKYFLFSPLFGEDEPILTNIFQMG